MGAETAHDGTASRGASASNRAIGAAYLLAGLSYPAWALIAPGPNDPLPVWLAIGACFVAAALVAWRWNLSRVAISHVSLALGSIVTMHFFALASSNEMTPFYAVGSSMSVLATMLIARSPRAMVAYGLFVAVLTAVLYAAEPDPRKLAYWAGVIPVFLFAHNRLGVQLAFEERLEREVAERTSELSKANRRLRDEIRTRERLEEALRVQQKVEAVARMAGGISHDFNNLLTTIGVYAELIEEALPSDSSLRAEVGHIQQAQRQAASLAHQLLTLGRRSHVRLRVVDLDEVVSEMSSLLQRMLEAHEVVIALEPGEHPVRGNVDQLRQVVLNLALNARDAMKEPGRLSLETARCARSSLADKLGVVLDHEAYIMLAVTDTGMGMDEQTRCRAFDPFFSTKPPDRGSGLGLSTVHAIVSQADGHVRLDSEPDRGARVELYWPLATEALDSERASAPRAAETAGSARILLVEDVESVRTALRRVLVKAGHFVADAVDGEQALAILDGDESCFDLLITDVVMPGMSGFELAERVAQAHPEAKVMLISGYLDDRSLSDADGRFAFLAKPFTPKDLERKVGDVLGCSLTRGGTGSRSSEPRLA
jgi:signal transduction histidine kinase